MFSAKRLTTILGIPIKVHWSFYLLLLFIFGMNLLGGAGLSSALQIMAILGVLFVCVLLHELGHALAARYFNIRTLDITLLPIGGVARLTSIPREPIKELVIAAAGPFVNLVIAAGLLGAHLLLWGGLSAGEPIPFWVQVGLMNVALVVFNLLPAFPMDGGRLLRALLAFRFPHVRATRYAVATGKVMCALLLLAALFTGNLLLGLVVLFVWFGAQQELNEVELQEELQGIQVIEATRVLPVELPGSWTIGRAFEVAMPSVQNVFPVRDSEGEPIGVIERGTLLRAFQAGPENITVSEAMQAEPLVFHPNEGLANSYATMRSAGRAVALVREGNAGLGMISLASIHESAALARGIDRGPEAPRPSPGRLVSWPAAMGHRPA